MVNAEGYLRGLATTFPKYTLKETDKPVGDEKLAEWITKMVLRKDFRKTKVFEQTKGQAHE